MYLLDTNTCIAIIRAEQAVLKAFSREYDNCAVPMIVVSELYKGVYCSRRVEGNMEGLREFLAPLPIIKFDLEAAEEFGRIQAELKMVGRPTGPMDALIAATARSRSATLVTYNTRDFENIPNLRLEDWVL